MVKSMELKQRFRNQLRPLMEMLIHKRGEITDLQWEDLVMRTEESVLHFPEQYLSELPAREVLEPIIHELFKEFIER